MSMVINRGTYSSSDESVETLFDFKSFDQIPADVLEREYIGEGCEEIRWDEINYSSDNHLVSIGMTKNFTIFTIEVMPNKPSEINGITGCQVARDAGKLLPQFFADKTKNAKVYIIGGIHEGEQENYLLNEIHKAIHSHFGNEDCIVEELLIPTNKNDQIHAVLTASGRLYYSVET